MTKAKQDYIKIFKRIKKRKNRREKLPEAQPSQQLSTEQASWQRGQTEALLLTDGQTDRGEPALSRQKKALTVKDQEREKTRFPGLMKTRWN